MKEASNYRGTVNNDSQAHIELGVEDIGPQYGVLTPEFLGQVQRAEEAAFQLGSAALDVQADAVRKQREAVERQVRHALNPEAAVVERLLEDIDVVPFPESDDRGGIA